MGSSKTQKGLLQTQDLLEPDNFFFSLWNVLYDSEVASYLAGGDIWAHLASCFLGLVRAAYVQKPRITGVSKTEMSFFLTWHKPRLSRVGRVPSSYPIVLLF